MEIIASRVLWSFVFLLAWLAVRGELPALLKALTDRRIAMRLTASAALITCNWLLYVWAVVHGRVVEASLGYFINPLVNVLLGTALLSERLNRAQWSAIGLAAVGVGYLALATGAFPWIPLGLAMSFGLYGLVRKVIRIESLPGLAIETLFLVPLALGYFLSSEAAGTAKFGHAGTLVDGMLIAIGPYTAITLFLFAYGARLIPYATVGVLQYITPTLQLLCGLLVFHEPFEASRALGFSFIWAGLLIYAADGLLRSRGRQAYA
jgi:chloramphenicol-sensitive protein RarD